MTTASTTAPFEQLVGTARFSYSRQKRLLKAFALVFMVVYVIVTLFPFYVLFVHTFVSTKESTTLHLWIPRNDEMKVPIATVSVIMLPVFWNAFFEPYVYLDNVNTTVLPLIASYGGTYSTNFQIIYPTAPERTSQACCGAGTAEQGLANDICTDVRRAGVR